MNKRLLRSLLSLMVCMAMLLSLTPAALAESADAPSTEMAVGAVIHGFEVVENGEFALLNAKTTVLRHQKTGATVFFLINEDTNRAFDISFVTPLSDDKGIPHVFEHSTLDGSKKYPSASLFFNLIYQTYNTYMNAATYQVMTTYPVASLSEAQLLKYADFYLDSCFNPMIYEDESLARLRTFIYDKEHQKYIDDIASKRKTMVSTGDRSAKIRTYNYPQGRITDHRINYTIYNLAAFMDGDIQDCIDHLIVAENAERLKESEL